MLGHCLRHRANFETASDVFAGVSKNESTMAGLGPGYIFFLFVSFRCHEIVFRSHEIRFRFHEILFHEIRFRGH